MKTKGNLLTKIGMGVVLASSAIGYSGCYETRPVERSNYSVKESDLERELLEKELFGNVNRDELTDEEKFKLLKTVIYEKPGKMKEYMSKTKTTKRFEESDDGSITMFVNEGYDMKEYSKLDMSKISAEKIKDCENFWKNAGAPVDLPGDGKYTESDKLIYFIYKDFIKF